jgi:eukaryotic-like serine/threonine-protein kinase
VSLQRELQAGRIHVPRLLDLATQMADGLTAAHQAGFVHRELKPGNVMITRTGRVKIVDFGLAKAVPPSAPEATADRTLTAPHTVLGTPAYMSPEQAKGSP